MNEVVNESNSLHTNYLLLEVGIKFCLYVFLFEAQLAKNQKSASDHFSCISNLLS
jgi:hypothetical protein